MTTADAAGPPQDRVPQLDGSLVLDAASLPDYSSDNGHIVERIPYAILRPGSVDDIATMINYCRRRKIPIAARGQAHTTQGQALTEGVVIDTRSLQAIHSIEPDGADVDAGVLWTELLRAAAEQGLTPPVLTRFTGLSIAGTLSVGGFGAPNRLGAQVDRVQELQVVTGDGRIRSCSRRRNRDLFEAMLGGLGQCGVITRVRLDLVPAPPMARTYQLNYTDNAAYFRDFRTLLRRGELAGQLGGWIPTDAGLGYLLEGTTFFDPSEPPDDERLLRGLGQPASAAVTTDFDHLTWAQRGDAQIARLRELMDWDRLVKPYFSVLLGDAAIEQFCGEVIPALIPGDIGPGGGLLMFAQQRTAMTRPMLRLPDDEWVYLFVILSTSAEPGPDPEFADKMLARNRRLYDRVRALGGAQYPVGSLPLTTDDWRQHYGDVWSDLARARRRYDPAGILTPGPGIFPRR